MNLTRNTLGNLNVPNFILCKASEERVGILKCTSKTWVHKYNSTDTLSFEIPYMIDNVCTEFYEDIDVMKYIEVPTIGRFCIKDIEIINEGQHTEYKKVECQDYSALLGTRYLEEFSINTGLTGSIDGVKLFQPADQSHSLLHLILEKFPEWSYDYVSPSLRTMSRSFEITRQDVLSFMTGDISEAFECIFVFNSLSKTINVYAETEYGKDTNVHISYNTLLEKTEMSYSTDEIKTCLTLKGDEDLDIREVAMGYDRIYALDYYADSSFMSQSLLDAYHAWKTLMSTVIDLNLFTYKTGVVTRSDLQGKTYEEAFSFLLTKYQSYYTQLSEWQSTKLPYLVTSRRNPGYGTVSFTEDGSDAITFERQTTTVVVDSVPSSRSENTLYLLKNSLSYEMYRWTGTQLVNVNDWHDIALAELKALQSSAENLQAVAMKAGYGDADHARYVDTYLPAYYMYNGIQRYIDDVNSTISGLESDQEIIETDKNIISNKTSMTENFTRAQLKELSTFIREDELTSSNFVVTDVMTEEERFEMLNELLSYGEKELAKVSAPQIQFSTDLVNLFAIPEFDNYSGDFDIGNFVWVTIRDDYSIKAKVLEISVNFLDQSDFKVTFGNVKKTARNMFTDVTEALNAATAAATSVSFGASHWSAAAEQADSISDALSKGLLSQQYYLANAEDNETLINNAGIWITTTTGPHGRENTDNYDAIYEGGGRILYTSDGWRTVSMSVGRGDIQYPSIGSSGINFSTESRFGVFADYLIAGYVGGSIVAGGHIYSTNYKTSSNKTSGNAGTHINLQDGTFEFNNNGKKRLTLNSSGTLEVNGVIQASSGHIGCDDNGDGGFIIQSSKLYNGKSSFNSTSEGVYIGTDGISLGAYSNGKNPFSVSSSGYLVSKSGNIGGWSISNNTLSSGNISLDAGNNQLNVNDKFVVYNDGSFKASNGGFEVTSSGYMTCTSGNIAGWEIGSNSLSASNITISSSGSIKQSSGGVSSWSITSDGKATFKNISISQSASISSNKANPFGGTCVEHIKSISAEYVYANYIQAMEGDIRRIKSDYVQTAYLESQYLTAGQIRTEFLSADEIQASYIDANTIQAEYATYEHLNTYYLSANEIETNYLTANEIEATYLNVNDIDAIHISADNITTGTIDGDRVVINNARLHAYGGYTAILGDIVWNHETFDTVYINGHKVICLID